MKKNEKRLIELLIELEKTNKEIEAIKSGKRDKEIKQKAQEFLKECSAETEKAKNKLNMRIDEILRMQDNIY